MSDLTNGRMLLVSRAKRLRKKILQIFADCASWNQNARQPDESEINCDPDGALKRTLEGLDSMLDAEAKRTHT